MIPGIDDRSFRPVPIINYSPFRRGGKKKVGGGGERKKERGGRDFEGRRNYLFLFSAGEVMLLEIIIS